MPSLFYLKTASYYVLCTRLSY